MTRVVRYEPTPKASKELRDSLKNLLRVPFPFDEAEQADFALFLTFQGVQVTPSKKHPGDFKTDVDMCPFAWLWRQQRGEIRERAV